MPSSRGIFPTQGWNPGLPHCKWILYRLSRQGKPMNTGVGSLSLLQGIFPNQESNQEALCGPHQLILQVRNFPHGPVVKTPSFHCRGHEFDLELKSHMPH